MWCQVAAEPDLAPLLSELVDNSQGQEIYLRRPERYGLDSNKPTTFAQVRPATHYIILHDLAVQMQQACASVTRLTGLHAMLPVVIVT